MEYAKMLAQVLIALGILNVWILRFNKATEFRGGQARNMTEEFATYGLPVWFMWGVGGLKVLCALALLSGFWMPQLIYPAAIVLALLMVGAIGMHIKVGDALKKMAPAAMVFLLALLVAVR